MAGQSAGQPSGTDLIELTVPLRAEYASTIRTVAMALGADAGFSIDEIDDIRLGLSEVVSAFTEGADGERVHVSFHVGDGTARIEIRPEGSTTRLEPDELGLAILRSVTDHFEITDRGVVLVKRATEAADDPITPSTPS